MRPQITLETTPTPDQPMEESDFYAAYISRAIDDLRTIERREFLDELVEFLKPDTRAMLKELLNA